MLGSLNLWRLGNYNLLFYLFILADVNFFPFFSTFLKYRLAFPYWNINRQIILEKKIATFDTVTKIGSKFHCIPFDLRMFWDLVREFVSQVLLGILLYLYTILGNVCSLGLDEQGISSLMYSVHILGQLQENFNL